MPPAVAQAPKAGSRSRSSTSTSPERHGGVAVGAGHGVVDLREHHPRGVGGGPRGVHRRAERAEAVAVGRRELQEGRVEPHGAAREEPGDVREEDWHEVGRAGVDRAAERRPRAARRERRRDQPPQDDPPRSDRDELRRRLAGCGPTTRCPAASTSMSVWNASFGSHSRGSATDGGVWGVLMT